MAVTDPGRAVRPGSLDRAGPGCPGERLSLVDLLDRVLAGGVVISGEITLSIADVDLVVISLRALLTSVGKLTGAPPGEES
jgi:hypothetical protein